LAIGTLVPPVQSNRESAISTSSIVFEIHGSTDRGLKRETNEDAFLVSDLDSGDCILGGGILEKPSGAPGLICLVSDGMGGAKAGEVASSMAVQCLHEFLMGLKSPLKDPEALLKKAIEHANTTIFRRSEAEDACRGMGTTMTGVWIVDTFCYLGHVGDSRAYLFHDGVLQQLTRDHSLMNFLIDYGVMTSDQAESHVNRNIILEALGVKKDVSADTGCLTLQEGDTILLCSDGLYSTMDDEEIKAFLVKEKDLESLSKNLISEANSRGGPDNITVVLCRVKSVKN